MENWGRATLTSWLFIIDVPKTSIFKGYIVFFDPEKSLTAAGCLPELMAFSVFYNTSPSNQFPRPHLAFPFAFAFHGKMCEEWKLAPMFPFLDEFYMIESGRRSIRTWMSYKRTLMNDWWNTITEGHIKGRDPKGESQCKPSWRICPWQKRKCWV